MTLRQLFQALVTAIRELVRLAIDLLDLLWNWLLDLPVILYVFAILAFLARRPAVHVGEQCVDAFRAFRGVPKLKPPEPDWGYRFGLYLKRQLDRYSESSQR